MGQMISEKNMRILSVGQMGRVGWVDPTTFPFLLSGKLGVSIPHSPHQNRNGCFYFKLLLSNY